MMPSKKKVNFNKMGVRCEFEERVKGVGNCYQLRPSRYFHKKRTNIFCQCQVSVSE